MTDETRPFAEAWLVFDIGCIECGESSAVVGIYGSKSDADANMEEAKKKQEADWHGQHSFEMFDVSREVSTRDRIAAAKALREAADCGANWCSDEVKDGLRSRADAVERGTA